jgi:RNA polymerase sigma-70 factor, ECF subfamily
MPLPILSVNRFGNSCYKHGEISLMTNPDADADDAALLARFRARDRTAFDTLYDRYAGRVLAFALPLTQSHADAEDLTQETFVAAFQGADTYRGGSRLLTWLFAIALRRWRDGKRRPRLTASPLLEESDQRSDCPGSSVEATAVATVVFRQAVGRLDEPLRVAFLLVVSQGLTHCEAAEVLRTPVGTVKWRVAEATKRLRAALSEDFSEEPRDERGKVSRLRAGG